MPLSQKAIDELKILYLETTGETLDDDAAWDMGHRLLRLYDLATRRPSVPLHAPRP